MIARVNPLGVRYVLSVETDSKGMTAATRITLSGRNKSIVVQHPLEKINEAWFNWTEKHFYIQNAFRFLTSCEREFLLTGITPAEWNEMFPDE